MHVRHLSLFTPEQLAKPRRMIVGAAIGACGCEGTAGIEL